MFKTLQKGFSSFFKSGRNDGWQNIYTNLGTRAGRTSNTFYRGRPGLDQHTLKEIYRTNGIGKRIVNIVVDDAVRGFIEADRLLLKELGRVHAKQNLLDAGHEGRLFGGAILVAFIEDGQGFEKPLNSGRVEKLVSLRVFSRHQISWTDEDLCRDFYRDYFGKPEIFTIRPESGLLASDTAIRIHRSRCFMFGGDRCSDNTSYWDEPVLEACYEALRNYGIVTSSSAEIVHDFIQVIMKMSGLSDRLINGEDEAVLNRINVIDRTKSVANLILLDGDGAEDYEKKASSVAGLAELWDRFSESICAVTGIPATRLFGKSPGGLNSTGSSDMQNWYDMVRAYRGDQMEPCIDWLISILRAQKGWQDKPDTYEWEFPSLTAPSELEWAEIKKKYAEIDCMYIDRGAIDAAEVWQERFGKGDFHFSIRVGKPDLEENLKPEEGNYDLLKERITD